MSNAGTVEEATPQLPVDDNPLSPQSPVSPLQQNPVPNPPSIQHEVPVAAPPVPNPAPLQVPIPVPPQAQAPVHPPIQEPIQDPNQPARVQSPPPIQPPAQPLAQPISQPPVQPSAQLPVSLPAPDPALPQAMTAMSQAMTALLAQLRAPPVAPAPAFKNDAAPAPAPRGKIKARDPDPYDGSDPTKLRAFISQCRLVFRAPPRDFEEDHVKITYAVSWLTGTAQRWYEPTLALADDELPDFALYWEDFEEALKTTFGKPDPVASASYKLDQLVMKDTHHVNKYNVEFNELATITGYDERALFSMYYRGLPARIKDAFAINGKLDTLDELRNRAQAINARHWERKEEDRHRAPTSSSSPSKSSSATAQSPNRTSSYSSGSQPRHNTPFIFASKPKTTDIGKVLGPDGKLLPAERDRRRRLNLCLLCASKDHMVDACPSRRDKAQARAVTIGGRPKPPTEAKPSVPPN